MHFTIYHSETVTPDGNTGIGLEIQPPLLETAQGTATILAQKPEGFSTGREHLIDSIAVTRNDLEGTAFVATPNFYNSSTSARLARALGKLVDPCNLHEITYSPPLPE